MTNRNSPQNMTRGIKKPRLRRVEITFQGTPEPMSNGVRPHGGYRGSRPCPPGQFSHNKNDGYQEDIEEELKYLIDQEQYEKNGGSPFWLAEIQRETTHSGESPLFTNKLLASGKFEQEHGYLKFERAILGSGKKRLWSAPNRRKAQKQFYRQNRTHQYLSATDLRKFSDLDECVIKYGRPTRTTLLRAMQRSNSAPVNAYDLRRENMRRVEDLRNHSIFYTSKEFYNIYSSDGETMHSFLTGARYNRAHLLDSKGLEVYGVYMPRENPAGCFMTGMSRIKDPGDEIPSAPPDSPRSDLGDSPSPDIHSRPDSSKFIGSRPTSSRTASSLPTTRTPPSRPQSYRQTPGSRPRSAAWEHQPSYAQNARTNVKSSEGNRRLPDEITMLMPDHVNPKGKAGVYVTLKGQKMLDTVESKLPRVTGISLPNLRRRHDAVEETLYVNQPPPTPVDVSLGSLDRTKFDVLHGEYNQQLHVDQIINEEMNYENTDNAVPNTQPNKLVEHHKEVKFADRVANIDINGERNIEQINSETQQADNKQEKAVTETEQKDENVIEKQVLVEDTEKVNKLTVAKSTKVEPEAKKENIDAQQTETSKDTTEEDTELEITKSELTKSNQVEKDTEHNENTDSSVKENNVVFFVTEESGEKNESLTVEEGKSGNNKSENSDTEDEDVMNSNQVNNVTVDTVIRVEVSENEKKEPTEGHEPDRAITSEDFPFTDDKTNDQQDYIV